MNLNKRLIIAALAATGALGAGVAQAHEADVQWAVTIGAPIYAQSAPAYTRSAPVYGWTAPIYAEPAPMYQRPRYHQPTRWDRDGDGIPNRYDPVYNPIWDRDGDGIPNRYDRFDNSRHDRDGHGVPDRFDRHDGPRWRDR